VCVNDAPCGRCSSTPSSTLSFVACWPSSQTNAALGSIGHTANNKLCQAFHRSRPVDSYLPRLLLYADDGFLLATAIEALTCTLNQHNAICEDVGLEIKCIKTEVQDLE